MIMMMNDDVDDDDDVYQFQHFCYYTCLIGNLIAGMMTLYTNYSFPPSVGNGGIMERITLYVSQMTRGSEFAWFLFIGIFSSLQPYRMPLGILLVLRK